MDQSLLFVLLAFLVTVNGQTLYFPDDDALKQYIKPEPVQQLATNLTELRGTNQYNVLVDQILSNGLIKLNLGINKAIIEKNNGVDNIVYAPVSIGAALALLLLGANGKTFHEIISIMGLTSGLNVADRTQIVHEQFGRLIKELEKTSGFDIGRQVHLASAIFVQEDYPIRNLYKQTAADLYRSEIFNVNFGNRQSKDIINAWVSDRTNGKITNMLNEPPIPLTKIIIISAMYFKAEWEYPFFKGSTKRRPFYMNGRKSASHMEVEMMANGGVFPYYRDNTLNCEIMGFPYKGNKTTMYVVLPNNSTVEKLKRLESILTTTDMERLVSNVRPTPSIILFPKMKIDSTIDLRQALEKIGLKSLFNPGEANLALISPGTQPTTPFASVNPIAVPGPQNQNNILIFNRMSKPVNCTEIFNANSTVETCEEIVDDNNQTHIVTYKRIGKNIGRRVSRDSPHESLDSIRKSINQQSTANNFQNPGLYADKVLHKVYMDITETGTEAAAVTSVSLSRDGSRVAFRVDVPFLFFIRHEVTKTILFWGSVNAPTPNFKEKH